MGIIIKLIKKKLVVKVIFVFIMTVVIIRYNSINREFPDANIIERNMHEIIKLNSDVMVMVENISLCEVEKYNEDTTQAIRNLGGMAKVAVVETKFQNKSNQNMKIEFYKYVLQNKVWSNGINPDLFFALNPENINMDTVLEPNNAISVKLPYVIYDFQVKKKQWEELTETQFDLVFSVYPDRRIIHMNNGQE